MEAEISSLEQVLNYKPYLVVIVGNHATVRSVFVNKCTISLLSQIILLFDVVSTISFICINQGWQKRTQY